jgi:hypothetical protein
MTGGTHADAGAARRLLLLMSVSLRSARACR